MDRLLEDWLVRRGWSSFAFQEEVWRAYEEGKSGLIHSATGSGKTLAAWLGPLSRLIQSKKSSKGFQVLWITPLRALAGDTFQSLLLPVQECELDIKIELRTGDTSSSAKSKQKTSPPDVLITTPESLSLLLSSKDVSMFSPLHTVIVDEWHELMGSKRGVQTELCLARLRTLCPGLQTWGISATLGNLEESMQVLLGPEQEGALIQGRRDKQVEIDTLLPSSLQRFPWAGHFGTQMIGPVINLVESCESSLIFTNTRAQAEIWHQSILQMRPDLSNLIGLHHGSMERTERESVEAGLKSGELKAVVCTSSLDLGVDFTPVDRVIQVGSPKGIARLLQRAGRSGHQPGKTSRLTFVPTHAFELVDLTAARKSALKGEIEARTPCQRSLDVLAQHLVTLALGAGFQSDEMYQEVTSTFAYRELTRQEFDWTLEFVSSGGKSLAAYDQFKKVSLEDGKWKVSDTRIARQHRMSIGTIVSEAAINVCFMNGSRIGTVEESFIARLKSGDRFLFAGKALEFVLLKDLTAYVRASNKKPGMVPRWAGGRMPLSSELSKSIREELERARDGELDSEEMRFLAPILEIQSRWSCIPRSYEFLIERFEDREGFHHFFYPFEGRLVHEGLAALFAYRISKKVPVTFTLACNDYGFELLSATEIAIEEAIASDLLSTENLAIDIIESLNAVEMARRQFREIARISGLVFQGYPGAGKSAKQMQVSSGLLFDVFHRYDRENRLLTQSFSEVLERQLEEGRLGRALLRLQESEIRITEPGRPTPLCFPILVDRLRETVTSESVADRIERLSVQLEKEADLV